MALPGCATFAPRSRAPGPDARVVPGIPLVRFEGDRCGAGSLALVLGAGGDAVSPAELERELPLFPGRGVLSVDLLIAARRRGFDAALLEGDAGVLRGELTSGRPAILMLRLLDAPGTRRDIYHYVVADGVDPGRGLVRFQFGDGKARWARVESLEGSWKPAGHALLLVRARSDTDQALARAVALEGGGRLAEAEALYRQVLLVRPESVRAWVDLGNVTAGRGGRDEAEGAYRRALELAADDRDALNNLAWLLLEEGARLEEAERLATRAASQPGPDRHLALDTLGRIQLARGRCEQAVRTLQEALASEGLTETATAALRDALRRAGECRPADRGQARSRSRAFPDPGSPSVAAPKTPQSVYNLLARKLTPGRSDTGPGSILVAHRADVPDGDASRHHRAGGAGVDDAAFGHS